MTQITRSENTGVFLFFLFFVTIIYVEHHLLLKYNLTSNINRKTLLKIAHQPNANCVRLAEPWKQ